MIYMRYGRGTPTAISGWEYGVRRRLEALQSLTSFEGKTVLDIGCGFGAYGLATEKRGAKISVGVDINREYIKRSALSFLVLADAHVLPFRDSCFDIVLMVEVLEHLSHEVEALKEARRVLKKGGLLLLTVPNKFYPFETHGMKISCVEMPNMLGIGIPLLSWMPSFVRERVERAKIYTQKQLINLLHKQGFMPMKVEYMMPPLDRLKRRKLAVTFRRLLRKLEATWLKYFACHIIVVSMAIK
jgi:ubiquinone/menaquinone biosynthesis C-methylase UbiE